MNVWYASYGSNLSLARFRRYLQGGRPDGATRVQPGCRDVTAPTGDRPLVLSGQVRFAGHAPSWGGGVAFLDTGAPAASPGRAYRLSVEQLADVVAQENGLAPGSVVVDLASIAAAGQLSVCEGWYGAVAHVGDLDGEAVFTITAPDADRGRPLAPPSASYVRTIAIGLAEAHGWSPATAARHLLACPGVRPAWAAASLEAACGGTIGAEPGYSTPRR